MYNDLIYKVLISKKSSISAFKFIRRHLLWYVNAICLLALTYFLFLGIYTYFFITKNLIEISHFFAVLYIIVTFVFLAFFIFASSLIVLRINATMDSNQAIKIYFKNKNLVAIKFPWVTFYHIKKIDFIINKLKKNDNPLETIYCESYS